MYHGDFRLGDTFDIKFTTRAFSTGAPTTLSGVPVISAYPGNSTTELTAGITLSVDFDTRTGLNNVRVVASSGNGYATATNYTLVITTGTVGGVSVVGECIGSFSIEARSAVMPTVAARTLDVSAGGEAGLDWANIGSPTTTVNLSGTTIQSSSLVTTGTAQAGAAMSITLAAGASAVDGTYDPGIVRIRSGTGAGQIRNILDYNGTSKVAIVDRQWRTNPDATSVYEILAGSNLISVNEGLAQGGGASTITLNSSADANNNVYVGQTVQLRGGTGSDQARIITAYNGTTKVATVSEAWAVNPDATSVYIVWPLGAARLTGTQTYAMTGSITGSVSGSVGSVTAGVTVTTNSDKTGYSLTQTFPTNFSALAITAGGAMTVGTNGDKTGYSLTQAFPTNFSTLVIDGSGQVTVGINNDKTSYGVSTGSQINIAGKVWDELLAGHAIAGSAGAALSAAGTAGDPWITALPGAYGAGTAGFLVGTYVNASISAVKAKTDNLPAAPAAVSDIPTAVQNADALLGRNVAGGSSTGRLVKEALYVMRNRTNIVGGTLSVYGTDDTTVAFTAAVQTTAGNPISQIDPA